MSDMFHIDHKIIAIGALTATGALALYSTWKYVSLRKKQEHDNVYETETYLNQFLLFHYGNRRELSDPWSDRISEKLLFFTKNIVDLCVKHSSKKSRAIEIGCAVGGSTFELARHFDKVVGFDYSRQFVDTCLILKENGNLPYSSLIEGELYESCNAVVDPEIDRRKIEFQCGDACCISQNLGQFDCVLVANIMCRLQTPKNFLNRLAELVAPSGIVVFASPYAFFTKFTPRENWFGGFKTEDGVNCTGADGIGMILSPNFELILEMDLPMVMRESKREFYLAFSHVLIWRRK